MVPYIPGGIVPCGTPHVTVLNSEFTPFMTGFMTNIFNIIMKFEM